MFAFFKKPIEVSRSNSTTDEIRKCAKTVFITPARQRGEKTVTFSASDICDHLTAKFGFQTICTAIDAKKFSEYARARLLRRSGARQGATARWTFQI